MSLKCSWPNGNDSSVAIFNREATGSVRPSFFSDFTGFGLIIDSLVATFQSHCYLWVQLSIRTERHMSKKQITAKIEFHPLTANRWRDFESLFGERGACGGCWCMNWRLLSAQFERQKGKQNRKAFKKIVTDGKMPGILGYSGDVAVIWCSIAPRLCFPRMEKAPTLKAVDDKPVWSVTCLFMAKEVRRKGLSTRTLKAAVDFARSRGASIVEGYPFEPKNRPLPDPFVWTGMTSSYLKAGFKEVARHSPSRPIMRRYLKKKSG